ncbi:MAG TPA: tRNA 2-thiouridine(34) synthase MnmA [Propionibacteriaceae bacterium]|nr:tRNA 2-thiouridine(34) synthase MnmA [Micropruina sp.]HBX80722.1 tRNA 2-thiouridine(34) synthase MnmA [Propionibacteriaceae bacterium]HBY23789.1 tRNA 2-thiouridine(34) synthase MnmA [Propionibacteriaceae bacterium]
MRMMVALSGGVDSAVVAARAVDAGHDVTAVHMRLWRPPETSGFDPAADARLVADYLGIPCEVWDFADEFHTQVVDYFVGEYAAGRTPNPCLRCNRTIKFGRFLQTGIERGFDMMATGHYARREIIDGEPSLLRSTNTAKDQSYVLGVLTAAQLARIDFPLGGITKDVVRAEAAARGIPVASKPDSTDICFIPTGDTAGFLSERLGVHPGEIVDEAGVTVGAHEGAHRFTVGQRRGLRLGVPAADGRPRFVLNVRPKENQIIVGPHESLAVRVLDGVRPTWTTTPRGTWHGLAQVRAHGQPLPATFESVDDGLRVTFDAPVFGVAPGQFVVCYDGDRVIGSAEIARAGQAQATPVV